MAKEDRRCAFCQKEILWNEEFSMENGQEFHVACRTDAGLNTSKPRRLLRNGMVRFDKMKADQ